MKTNKQEEIDMLVNTLKSADIFRTLKIYGFILLLPFISLLIRLGIKKGSLIEEEKK